MTLPSAVLATRAITKVYPGVVANDEVSFDVSAGEIHALVGENGAGKSTLMKIVYGEEQPDSGEVLVDGKLATPRHAIDQGIGLVHQHFMLADNLTVWENVILGAETQRGPFIDSRAACRRLAELSASYGLNVEPRAQVGDLGVGSRQRVEILKVLFRGARVMILDEPTAVLVPHEIDQLMSSLVRLKGEGVSIVFISHKLEEVMRIADRITVMRGGTVVGTVDKRSASREIVADMMVEGSIPRAGSRTTHPHDTTRLTIADLSTDVTGRPALRNASLSVRAGEIVGIAGVEGNGQSELLDAVLGVIPSSGTVLLDGFDVTRCSTIERRRRGLASIAEDRHRQGILLRGALWENQLLGNERLRSAVNPWWVDRTAIRAETDATLRAGHVKAPGPDTPAYALSGGNQQKFVVARELSTAPAVLLAAHPTRGVDIGAQAQIWASLRTARGRRAGHRAGDRGSR